MIYRGAFFVRSHPSTYGCTPIGVRAANLPENLAGQGFNASYEQIYFLCGSLRPPVIFWPDQRRQNVLGRNSALRQNKAETKATRSERGGLFLFIMGRLFWPSATSRSTKYSFGSWTANLPRNLSAGGFNASYKRIFLLYGLLRHPTYFGQTKGALSVFWRNTVLRQNEAETKATRSEQGGLRFYL